MLRKVGRLWGSYRNFLPSVRFSSVKSDNVEHYDEFPDIYPDFARTPIMGRRNMLREKLERADMLNRRMNLDIPEFYVGSIVAVTNSDPNISSKQRRFVGICIRREKEGLQHTFTLRNVVDGLGVEIILEKRLDDDLSYLIDCLPEYSTFDFNLEPISHPAGTPVPVNETKVKLRPPPWSRRWELYPFKGIENSWELETPNKKRKLHKTKVNDWRKYDLIADYRSENKFLEHELAVEEEIRKFEEIQHKSGLTKKKILRSAQRHK